MWLITMALQESDPIRVNPNGKYNLNFIDWDNEWEQVFEAVNYYNNNRDVPIDGMDIATFESLYVSILDLSL